MDVPTSSLSSARVEGGAPSVNLTKVSEAAHAVEIAVNFVGLDAVKLVTLTFAHYQKQASEALEHLHTMVVTAESPEELTPIMKQISHLKDIIDSTFKVAPQHASELLRVDVEAIAYRGARKLESAQNAQARERSDQPQLQPKSIGCILQPLVERVGIRDAMTGNNSGAINEAELQKKVLLVHQGLESMCFGNPVRPSTNLYMGTAIADELRVIATQVLILLEKTPSAELPAIIEELLPIYAFARTAEIAIRASMERQQCQLEELVKEFNGVNNILAPDADKATQLEFAIRFVQILDNPLELKCEHYDMNLAERFGLPKNPESEEQVRALKALAKKLGRPSISSDKDDLSTIAEAKQRGISALAKFYRQHCPERAQISQIVSGAGPCGLTQHFLAKMAGYDSILLERETAQILNPDDDLSRKNVLYLGKHASDVRLPVRQCDGLPGMEGDVSLLYFSGALERALLVDAMNYTEATSTDFHEVQVPIVQLQNQLHQNVMDAIDPHSTDGIVYESCISAIHPGDRGFCVNLRSAKNQEVQSRDVQRVFVTEGRGSTSRQQLGGYLRGLSEKSGVSVTWHKEGANSPFPKLNSALEVIKARVGSPTHSPEVVRKGELVSSPALFRKGFHLVSSPTSSPTLGRKQYLYSSLPPELDERLRILNGRLRLVEGNDPQKEKAIRDEMKQIVAPFAKEGKKKGARIWEKAIPGMQLHADYTQAEVMMSRILGRTSDTGGLVMIMGDSSTQTDPVSGSGARSAIIGAALSTNLYLADGLNAIPMDDPILKLVPNNQTECIALGRQSWDAMCCHNQAMVQRSMREEGLTGRHITYEQASETRARFLDVAEKNGAFSFNECQGFMRMVVYRQNVGAPPPNRGLELFGEEVCAKYRQRNGIPIDGDIVTSAVARMKDDLLKDTKLTDAHYRLITNILKAFATGQPCELSPENEKALRGIAARLAEVSYARSCEMHPLPDQPYDDTAWLLFFAIENAKLLSH